MIGRRRNKLLQKLPENIGAEAVLDKVFNFTKSANSNAFQWLMMSITNNYTANTRLNS